jgi:hypothetical protein
MLGLFTTKAPVAVFATLTILDLKFLKIIIFVIVKKLMNLPCMRRVKQRKDWFFKESHTKTGVLKCVLGGICFGSIVPFIGFLLSLLTTMPEYLADTVEIGSFVFGGSLTYFPFQYNHRSNLFFSRGVESPTGYFGESKIKTFYQGYVKPCYQKSIGKCFEWIGDQLNPTIKHHAREFTEYFLVVKILWYSFWFVLAQSFYPMDATVYQYVLETILVIFTSWSGLALTHLVFDKSGLLMLQFQ